MCMAIIFGQYSELVHTLVARSGVYIRSRAWQELLYQKGLRVKLVHGNTSFWHLWYVGQTEKDKLEAECSWKKKDVRIFYTRTIFFSLMRNFELDGFCKNKNKKNK